MKEVKTTGRREEQVWSRGPLSMEGSPGQFCSQGSGPLGQDTGNRCEVGESVHPLGNVSQGDRLTPLLTQEVNSYSLGSLTLSGVRPPPCCPCRLLSR